MMPSHEPWLVALSLFVAFQGSYVGLHLARQVAGADGMRRRALVTGAALTLALGIWTMHFVGMVALRLPAPVDFLALPTVLSFLVCVLVVGVAVFAAAAGPVERTRLALAAVFMGAGIVAMHYLGMSALHASVHMTHDPFWVATSIVVGIGASGISLWLGFGQGSRRALVLPAALMGLAISAMHYSAMAGVTFHRHAAGDAGMPALSQPLLAILVSVVTFVVSGLFLLSLIPDRTRGEAATIAAAGEGAAAAAAIGGPAPAPATAGLAGDQLPAAAVAEAAAPPFLRALPVEKDGRQRQLDVGRLVAVQAQAHYTQLFDGEQSWFCPLSISEVEAALDPSVFARVHRSHIVNLDRVSSLKNAADAPAVAMSAAIPYRAPVSRSRRRWVKQRLEERAHLAE